MYGAVVRFLTIKDDIPVLNVSISNFSRIYDDESDFIIMPTVKKGYVSYILVNAHSIKNIDFIDKPIAAVKPGRVFHLADGADIPRDTQVYIVYSCVDRLITYIMHKYGHPSYRGDDMNKNQTIQESQVIGEFINKSIEYINSIDKE